MSTPSSECQICCEKFTKQQRKPTVCNECDNKCCSQCIKTYVLGQSAEPHCMNCSKPFTREFLKENLGITFMKSTYRDKKKELLYEVEKSKLPTSMVAAQRYKKSKEIKDDVKLLFLKREQIREQEKKINNEMIALNSIIWNLENGVSDSENEKKKRQDFVRKCSDELCNGFMSSQWKCGICKKFACPQCHEVIGMRKTDPHVCDEDTVKTIASIKNDTKPCPKCYSPIFKISGCDQMWCTQCEVAFSWKTGDVQRGNIHNPHFYEARRKLGINTRNPGDVVCGGLIDPFNFRRSLQTYCRNSVVRHYVSIQPNMTNIDILFHLIYAVVHRSTSHNIHILDRLRQEVRDCQSTERQRVLFLVGEKDEESFKRDIYRNNEALIKKRRMCDIFETYINVMIENINAMAVNIETANSADDAFKKTMELYCDCEKITKYTNCEFLRIAYEYRQATYLFDYKTNELIYKRIPSSSPQTNSVDWGGIKNLIEKTDKQEYTKMYTDYLFRNSIIGRYITGYNNNLKPGALAYPLSEFVNCINVDDVAVDGCGGAAAAAKT